MSTNQLAVMAKRLNVAEDELHNIVVNTVMPNRGNQVSNEQFVSFLAVANEYKLNPLKKEIYAFPGKGGGIQPIVSIDGWLGIINRHPDFNGMVHEDIRENGELLAITCKIYKKGIEHPITVTEYMDECKRNTDTWKTWPARMLRHKATIQAGRYAFGLSGIVDPDEAERISEATEKDMGAAQVVNEPAELPPYPEADFNKNIDGWRDFIESGRITPDDLIAKISTKGVLSESQQEAIRNLLPAENNAADDFYSEYDEASNQ